MDVIGNHRRPSAITRCAAILAAMLVTGWLPLATTAAEDLARPQQQDPADDPSRADGVRRADGPDGADGGAKSPVLTLLPDFDPARLIEAAEVVDMPPSRQDTETAAKLLWGLRRIAPRAWADLAEPYKDILADDARAEENAVVRLRGLARAIQVVSVPEALAERLELERVYRVMVEAGGDIIYVVTAEAPEIWRRVEALNEPIEVTGLRIGGAPREVVFAPRLQWSPDPDSSLWPVGWRLLGRHGFDSGLLAGVAQRTKAPLGPADSRPFYEMLAIADAIGDPPGASPGPVVPEPRGIALERMLRQPESLVGHWIRLPLHLARVHRVAVTSETVQQRLGRDWYWQIDAFGDLGDVRIALEPPSEEGEPVIFENRFPVTLAVAELPEWLEAQVETDDAGRVDMSMIREDAIVTGFFYRLWSYESEFTSRRGGRQIAPLVLASTIRPREMAAVGGGGIDALGWGLAAVVITGILATVLISWRISRQDRVILQRRRHQHSSQ